MSKIFGLVTFVLGAAAGSAATWFVLKEQYEQRYQEDVASYKKVFGLDETCEELVDIDDELPDGSPNQVYTSPATMMEYAKELSKNGYTNYATVDVPTVPETVVEDEEKDKPYVITPDEFRELEDEGYSTLSFTYLADNVLLDDIEEVVENVDELVGIESLTHFGEYEDDSVFVRNDILKCDYEILRDERTYAEFIKDKPYKAGT